MPDEVEIEVCCDIFLEAVESGLLPVVEVQPGAYAEVLPDPTGESGIRVNFCPFCGHPRPLQRAETDAEAGAKP